MKRIPQHLKPQNELPVTNAPVDLPSSRDYNPEQIDSLQSRLGLLKVDGNRLGALKEYGMAARSLGIADLQTGATMITIDTCMQIMAYHAAIVADPDKSDKQKAESSRIFGYLQGQLARTQSNATKMAQVQANVIISTDKKMRQSFAPGVVVNVPQQSEKSTDVP